MAKSSTTSERVKIPIHDCSTISEFLRAIADELEQPAKRTRRSLILWRGQSDAEWPLEPALQRIWKDQPEGLLAAEQSMFKDFTTAARYLMPTGSLSEWEWLSIAQHYGMPTRLLDWTMNHMVALWFALSGVTESDAAVWGYRPPKSNLLEDRSQPDPQSTHDDQFPPFASPFTVKQTTVFRPIVFSPRVAMQAAWHTVHKYSTTSSSLIALDRMDVHKRQLVQFRVPASSRAQMLEELEQRGISVTTVFGDLPSLCVSIGNRYRPTNSFLL